MKNYHILRGLISSQGLSTLEKMVAVSLLHYRNEKTGRCTPAQILVAYRAGCSLRGAAKAIARLDAIGLIDIKDGPAGLRQYDFSSAAFSLINSMHHVHTLSPAVDLSPTRDAGCLPSIESLKPGVNESPIPDGMTRLQFLALKQFVEDVTQPSTVQLWPLNLDAVDTHTTRCGQADPVDLGGVEWAKHKQRARELVGGA